MVDFTLTPEIRELRRKTRTFLEDRIIPNEPILARHDADADALMKDLQARVKDMGMWAMFIGPEAGGTGTGFLPYAYVNEILGRSPFAPRAFGCAVARHRQRRDPAPVRHARSERAVHEAARRGRNPVVLLDD
jgi:alkylation response protein AidB-like acyl-CoA dehydrogenase